MRVACITSSYPRHDNDHAGRFVAEWVEVLGEHHEIEVFTWNDGHATPVHTVRYAPRRWETLFYGDGAPENIRTSLPRLAWSPVAVGSMIAAVMSAGPFDLIVGHWAVPGGLIARAVGDFLNVPSLVVCHSGGVHLLRKFPTIKKIVGDGPTTVVTSAQKDVFPNARVTPMGFRSTGAKATGEEILIMSRLVPIKNIDRVLRDFADVPNHPTIHIAGDGPERRRLEMLAEKNRGVVTFHGFVSGGEKRELMERCGYFFLPSTSLNGRHEGMPIGLLESMDAGLVPLVARFPGIEDLLPDSLIVEEGDSFLDRFGELASGSCDPASLVNALTWSSLSPIWHETLEQAREGWR